MDPFKLVFLSLSLSTMLTLAPAGPSPWGAARAEEPCPAEARPAKHSDEKADLLRTIARSGKGRTLLTALVVAELVEPLRGSGPFTVFAPTDDAFGKLPSQTLEALLRTSGKAKLVEVLKYHVVPGRYPSSKLGSGPRLATLQGGKLTVAANGRGVAVDGATVVEADIECSNGVVHFIDRVLTPKADDLLAVAEKAGSFETLRKAVKAAGLEDALRGSGPLTVLAPTDEAFAKLGHEKLRALLQPRNRQLLASILKYHVIPGRVTARDAVAAGEAKTLEGRKVTATIRDGRLAIDDATVRATDVEASNGIIHAIDSVLIPGKND